MDPGVGSARRVIAGRTGEQLFIAPDNGLLGAVLGDDDPVVAVDVDRFSLAERSRTFHGRDVFAPTAAALAAGHAPDAVGERITDWVRLEWPAPRDTAPDERECEVLFADRFGNLLTNLGALPEGLGDGSWEMRIGARSVPVRGTYAEAERGELLALVNSYDLLELAVRDGSAAETLGEGPGAQVVLRRHA